ncbi:MULTISPECIES: hypothetical protein [unclassified Bradyrhizobium]|uniref:hypothetical protein n=1 Tax=unclassified Bradyrhizobium TaxID=2631580 RepID=UPI0028F05732|nr:MULTISPECIES: hypothetical protein [unclassified Bradyrhizobium]
MLHPRPLSAAVLLICFAPPVAAETAVEVARDWGLLGTWAVDCAKPPRQGQGSTISYEATSEGHLIYRRDLDSSDNNEVTGARIEPDHTLVLSITMPRYRQTRENGVTKEADGSIRSIFNRSTDGSYTIRDGRFVANGKPTPSLRKCE